MNTRQSKRRKFSEGIVLEVAEFHQWNPAQVANYLTSKGYKNEAKLFEEEEISGKCLESLTEDSLERKVHVRTLGKRLEILKVIEKMTRLRDNSNLKVFNDPIHGQVDIHPLCIRIIDTQQFQRLRYIKQLGCCYLVFPGAAHNRFEHSLGVCHLAGTFCRKLQEVQPELNITEKDVLCVQIAGLCHDLGHGPFSHVFDQFFIPKVRPGYKWAHEQASEDMFDHLIKANELEDVFVKFGLGKEDIIFIKELINGPSAKEKTEWPYRGRPKDKSFLYEIVANKRSGVDVDKWDYFLRDCHNLGITTSFDCHRFMKFCRVIEVEGERQICPRDKEVENLYDMFNTRISLYRRACQHKVNKIIEIMIVEALEKANDHFLVEGTKVKGKERNMLKMSAAINDMVAYTKLTDDIILEIMRSSDPSLKKSQDILKLVQERKLYKYIGQTQYSETTVLKQDCEPRIIKEIVGATVTDVPDGPPLTKDQLVVHLVNFNYGMGETNPIENVRFYSKKNPDKAFEIKKSQVSRMIPNCFQEQHIRVYCKSQDKGEVNKARKYMQSWCTENGLEFKAADVSDLEPSTDETPATPPRSSKDSTNIAPGRPSKDNTLMTLVKKNPKKLEFE